MIHLLAKIGKKVFRFLRWERRSFANETRLIMMFRLELQKTTGTKFVFNFREILAAPNYEVYKKSLSLLKIFKGHF